MIKVYTVKEAARILKVSEYSLYRAIRQGKVKVSRLWGSNRIRISQREISRLLSESKTDEELLEKALG